MNGKVPTNNQIAEMVWKKLFPLFFLFTFLGLFLYSFTQVDLNLTLSRISLAFAIQDFFQHIGYFNRPFSTASYAAILIALFVSYSGFLYAALRKWVTERTVWQLLIGLACLLIFSYPAFSYDIFNYMFDARIVTLYGENPYIHRALDFPSDQWLNFMRWTHRVYPYGPLWLILTVPLSFLGFGYFLPTLYLFKLLMVMSFAGAVFFISKILESEKTKNKLPFLIFFAFNPLIIIESLVSAHNDILMIFFSIVAVYLLFKRRHFLSFIFLLSSILIKFATIFLIPVFILKIISDRSGKKMTLDKFAIYALCSMLIAVVAASIRTQFQPWYLLYLLTFGSFLVDKRYFLLPLSVLSFGALMLYAPYIYLGNWDPPVPLILNSVIILSVFVALITVFATIKLQQKASEGEIK